MGVFVLLRNGLSGIWMCSFPLGKEVDSEEVTKWWVRGKPLPSFDVNFVVMTLCPCVSTRRNSWLMWVQVFIHSRPGPHFQTRGKSKKYKVYLVDVLQTNLVSLSLFFVYVMILRKKDSPVFFVDWLKRISYQTFRLIRLIFHSFYHCFCSRSSYNGRGLFSLRLRFLLKNFTDSYLSFLRSMSYGYFTLIVWCRPVWIVGYLDVRHSLRRGKISWEREGKGGTPNWFNKFYRTYILRTVCHQS